jgi:hypothetical protein
MSPTRMRTCAAELFKKLKMASQGRDVFFAGLDLLPLISIITLYLLGGRHGLYALLENG